MQWWPIVMLLAGLAMVPIAVAPAHASQPTRLRLEARTAGGLYTDGWRFAIIESGGGELTILDTFTRARRTLADTGCRVGGIQFGQTQVSAGRALLNCWFGPALLRLSTGTIAPLPARLDFDGRQNPADYHAVGAHWAVDEAGYCGSEEETLYCNVFVNHRTGEQRVVRRPYDRAERTFRDLDDPELARRTVCRPHRDVLRGGQRTYEPPYLLDGGAPRRCGSRREIRRLPEALPDLMNLSAGRVSWGNPFPDGDGRAFLFDLRRQRLFSWRVPRIRRRGRPPVSAVHTRREILIAATLTTNGEGDPLTVRVYRARLPAPPRW